MSSQAQHTPGPARIAQALRDAIPLGPHPDPHAEWVHVRLDFVQAAIAHFDQQQQRTFLGNCQSALQTAIGHLQAVLNKKRSHAEQQAADTAARDWLASIGSEPT